MIKVRTVITKDSDGIDTKVERIIMDYLVEEVKCQYPGHSAEEIARIAWETLPTQGQEPIILAIFNRGVFQIHRAQNKDDSEEHFYVRHFNYVIWSIESPLDRVVH